MVRPRDSRRVLLFLQDTRRVTGTLGDPNTTRQRSSVLFYCRTQRINLEDKRTVKVQVDGQDGPLLTSKDTLWGPRPRKVTLQMGSSLSLDGGPAVSAPLGNTKGGLGETKKKKITTPVTPPFLPPSSQWKGAPSTGALALDALRSGLALRRPRPPSQPADLSPRSGESIQFFFFFFRKYITSTVSHPNPNPPDPPSSFPNKSFDAVGL